VAVIEYPVTGVASWPCRWRPQYSLIMRLGSVCRSVRCEVEAGIETRGIDSTLIKLCRLLMEHCLVSLRAQTHTFKLQ